MYGDRPRAKEVIMTEYIREDDIADQLLINRVTDQEIADANEYVDLSLIHI